MTDAINILELARKAHEASEKEFEDAAIAYSDAMATIDISQWVKERTKEEGEELLRLHELVIARTEVHMNSVKEVLGTFKARVNKIRAYGEPVPKSTRGKKG